MERRISHQVSHVMSCHVYACTADILLNHDLSNSFVDLVSASSSVAFVAVLETLISGKIAETSTHVHMHSRREVFGVTMANLGSAMAGGMPSTAALARTALNIRSGAYSRISGMLNGIFTAIFAVVIMPTFQYLPLPIVGAMVAQVAVGMFVVMISILHCYHSHIYTYATWHMI
jgi:MFS superfamily sulfate permease-like transporter